MKKIPPVKVEKNQDRFSSLRLVAEELLSKRREEATLENEDIKLVFQELQVHQIELEMQNDELLLANVELEKQQLKLTGIYDNAPTRYFIADKTGIITDVNNTGMVMLHAGKSQIVNKRLLKFVSPECADDYYTFFKRMLAANTRVSVEMKMITLEGHLFYAQVEGIAIGSGYGEQLQCYINIIDITERIKAEQSLAETKERLVLALEASAAGTWELNTETMHFYLDEFNYRMCAVPNNKFDGRYNTFINMVHPDDQWQVDQHFRTAINTEKEVNVVCRFVNSNKVTCFVSIRGHMIGQNQQTRRYVGIMMDITRAKQMEQETNQLKINQQKNITIATMLAEENERRRISEALHDSVSQLLYGIKMQLGHLNLPKSTPAIGQIHHLLDTAVKEARNISFELAPSILKDFGLPAAIDELAARLQSPELTFETRFAGFNERMELLFETSVFRIIQELVNNCMKHSGANLVKIEVINNKSLHITVKDNGRGYNAKLQENKPTGAGLSSIKNRIGLYNGDLQIDSKPGKGTMVKIELKY